MAESKSESVKVAVRIRPINKNEQAENATSIITASDNTVTICDPTTSLTKNFGFDYIFDGVATNETIYNSIGKDIVKYACNGYNCCILAYGQTGSGKTYTMLNYAKQNSAITEFGLIPHIASELLTMSSPNIEYQVAVSFVEIYAEKIFDLLSDTPEKTSLKLHINPKIGTYIEGLTLVAVSSIDQIMRLIEKGFKHRSTSSTAMNEQSSRSHAIFNIDFKQILKDSRGSIISEKSSKIKLVDLAGSERVKTSKVAGVNFQEAIAINKSLSMLSTVINELVENGSSTKFRNSTLTALLADSISGNSKTVIIANVSPASIQYDISLQTLFYVHRTKRITVHAKINETVTHDEVNELKAEIERLKNELLKVTDPEEVQKLKEELVEYERLYMENSRSWSDKLKDLECEVSSGQTEIQLLIKSSHDEKEKLAEEIHNMNNEKTLLMCDKLKLANEKISLMSEIHELVVELNALHQNIEILKVENTQITEDLTRLKAERQSHIDKISRASLLFKPKQ